jgi:SpoVK/Ycf46/Vps4 family AAA+-type ATPase
VQSLAAITNSPISQILDLAVAGQGVRWDDIAGLEGAKSALYELVILPSLRPEFFTGLRKPPSGLLLFGPPGCGKTMLAKAVATEAHSAFFSISASALMSKYMGESEGLVKALFAVARAVAPSVIFIDEIDSLLSERSDNEHEASRRVKTELLIQWDGIQANASQQEKRVLIMGATNRPQDLDEAATRRLPARVYIPLPDANARIGSIKHLLRDTPHSLSASDFDRLAQSTNRYSQSDLANVCSQAAMGPVREMRGEGRVITQKESKQLKISNRHSKRAPLCSATDIVGRLSNCTPVCSSKCRSRIHSKIRGVQQAVWSKRGVTMSELKKRFYSICCNTHNCINLSCAVVAR